MSHLRQHLTSYLKRVQQGEAIQITSRGRFIARLQGEQDPAEEARRQLEGLQARVTLVDVLALADITLWELALLPSWGVLAWPTSRFPLNWTLVASLS